MRIKILALLGFVIVSAFASAQNLGDLVKDNLPSLIIQAGGAVLRSEQGRQEQIKVGKENDINSAQPSVLLKGHRVRFNVENNDLSNYADRGDAWLLAACQHMVTDSRVGATASFDEAQLQQLTSFFDQVNDNKYVDTKTKYGAELKAPDVQVNITTRYLESSSDLQGFIGSVFRGLGLSLERSTSYVGITFAVMALTGENAGNVVATYKVIGRSSVTDRLEVSLFDSLFSRQGFTSDTDEKQKRDFNAAEDAFKQLRGVLIQKATVFGR